jgi:hypothetical protein
MLTDLLQNIYNRIAQLGKAIQDLNNSLNELNQNIEEKITNLGEKMDEFNEEISVTQTRYIDTIKEIGNHTTDELKVIQNGLGLDAINNLISNLENFSKLAEEVLNQDTVNLLLSEAISSVKTLKKKESELIGPGDLMEKQE